jgi:hypothetical protein
MPTIVQFRRGTTAQNNSFTGAVGELSIDTDLETIRVHDGTTVGGFSLIQATATQTLTNKTLTTPTITGNTSISGTLTINTLGNAVALINGASNAVGNIGSASTYFNRAFLQATTALYADLAEMYISDNEYPPGTVLVFGGDQEVTISTNSHDSCVAGVVSTNPAHIMNSGLTATHTVALGLTGRVPCKVVGPVTKGQQLVTSDIPGVAQALDPTKYQPGVVIGKAIENYNEPWPACGVIEVVVGRL